MLCGSVSSATLGQIAHAARTQPVRLIDIGRAVEHPDVIVEELVAWVSDQPGDAVPIICAARDRTDVRPTVAGHAVAPVVEAILAQVAARLVGDGVVGGLIVAGGESSGAVVRALSIPVLSIGPELAPGICWSTGTTRGGREVALALKSGNFGREDLFTQAWDVLA